MTVTEPTYRICVAKTRRGTECHRPAGWGTIHVGSGNCKLHAGSTPGGIKGAARLEAEHLAAEFDIDPHTALLWAVRVAAGQVRYLGRKVADLEQEEILVKQYRARQATAGEGAGYVERSSQVDLHIWVRAHQEALDRLARVAKLAIDAGVEERQVRVLEQFAEGLAGTFGRIFEALGLSEEQRLRAPAIVERELLLLEAAK